MAQGARLAVIRFLRKLASTRRPPVRSLGWRCGFLPLCLALGLQPQAFGAASDALPRNYFGLHIHYALEGTPWPSFAFGSWRLWDTQVTWPYLEPFRNQWNFERLDRLVDLSAKHGVKPHLLLGLTPAWASTRPTERSAYGPGAAAFPKRLDDWANYVRAVVTRYRGRISSYEIWNEPSDPSYFSGTPEELVSLTCEAYREIKKIDPEILVVSPAAAGGGYHIDYLDKFLRAGGKRCIDIVAHHFYVFRYGPEAMVPLIRQVKQVMTRNGVGNLPLWNTETGWWIANGDGTPDHRMVAKGGWKKIGDREAADILVRAFLLARHEGVDRFYWYAWDNPYGLGLLEPTRRTEKPVAKAYGELMGLATGSRDLACTQKGSTWTCSFVSGDGKVHRYEWLAQE